MRLLLITDHWHPESNVPQRRWDWLSGVLKDMGHDVFVATPYAGTGVRPKKASMEASGQGATVLRTWGKKGGLSLSERALQQGLTALGSVIGVCDLLRKGSVPKPDVVIGTVPGLPTAVVTHVIARILKTPYVLDVRDAWPDLLHYSSDWNQSLGKRSLRERLLTFGPLHIVLRAAERAMILSYSRASLIFTTSENFASSLRDRLSRKRRPPQIFVVRNVFPPVVSLGADDLGQAEGLVHSRELRVIYAGKIGRAQGLDNAVRAVSMAESLGVPVVLRMIGSGVAVESLKDLSHELGVGVEFLGHMEGNELQQHYQWADTALVHLASWPPLSETVPSKVFELINSRMHVTGVVDGECALLLESLSAGHTASPGDPAALAKLWGELWSNPQMLSVGQSGERWVEREREEIVPRMLAEALDAVQLESDDLGKH